VSTLAAILDGLEAAASSAVAGLTVSRQPQPKTALAADSLPHLVVQGTDYSSTLTDYAGETWTWAVAATLHREGDAPLDPSADGVRETLALDLEAIRAAVKADPTLGGACEAAHLATASIDTAPDSGGAVLALVFAAEGTL